ncbi:MAG: DUF3253 domain-containing protein [Micrococcus sp.]|nr:DUF3253 domain-containing protein [Micrococcus sp.]
MGQREEPERTEDGRHIIVNGRRWRASDPHIPDPLRSELVSELMRARRAVRRDGDAARHLVQDAKVALGERGTPWWETTPESDLSERTMAAIRTMLRRRAEGTVCPSQIARIVDGRGWRDRMDQVREVAWAMEAEGVIEVRQKGVRVDRGARGPIRLGRGGEFPDA